MFVNRARRTATTITELLVACTIVGTLLTSVVPVFVHTDRLNREMSRHRLALDELSNQLDTLTLLRPDEILTGLEDLTVDPTVAARFPESQLSGELVAEDRGFRLTLRLAWRRDAMIEAPPVVLSAWVVAPEDGEERSMERRDSAAPEVSP